MRHFAPMKPMLALPMRAGTTRPARSEYPVKRRDRLKSSRQIKSSIWTLLILVIQANALSGQVRPQSVVDDKRHHLGIAGQPEWDEFAGDQPEGRVLQLSFNGRANAREATLLIRQDNVKLDWPVRLNGRPIGRLLPMEAALWHALAVPSGSLRDGANTLLIESPGQVDDIVIDQVAIDARPVREALGRATLNVSVTDAGTGGFLPCRITITDGRGHPRAALGRARFPSGRPPGSSLYTGRTGPHPLAARRGDGLRLAWIRVRSGVAVAHSC